MDVQNTVIYGELIKLATESIFTEPKKGHYNFKYVYTREFVLTTGFVLL